MNRAVLFGVLLITALHAFDELVLVISLPRIAADLNSDNWYGLIIAIYVLASIVGMAWAGNETDRIGPRKVLYIGAGFFFTGLILAIVSFNTATFMLARTFQGIGGGVGWTLSFGLVNLLSPAEEKPKAVAAMDVAWIIPSLLAPLIGGFLVDYLNWRWIFVLQLLPLGIAMILITPRIRHLDKTIHPDLKPDPSVLAYALLIAMGVGLLLYALGTPFGLTWLLIIPAIAITLKPLSLFMPAHWWTLKGPLEISLVTAMMAFMVFYGMEAYQPLYLIEVRGMTTLSAGLVLTSASISWMVASQLTAHKLLPSFMSATFTRTLAFGTATIFFSVIIFGLILFDWVPLYWSYVLWCFAGIGMGLTFNTARSTAMQYTPAGKEGFVASAVSLSVSLGLSLSTGFGGALRNQVEIFGGSLNDVTLLIWAQSLILGVLLLIAIAIYSARNNDKY